MLIDNGSAGRSIMDWLLGPSSSPESGEGTERASSVYDNTFYAPIVESGGNVINALLGFGKSELVRVVRGTAFGREIETEAKRQALMDIVGNPAVLVGALAALLGVVWFVARRA